MNPMDFNTALLQIGGPAMLLGLLLGALIAWLVSSRRQARLEAMLGNKEALELEREKAFEAARAQLTGTFSDIANKSLKSNSENFLRLAEQNLGAQQDKAKRDLGDREKAIEGLVKPIQEALQASQKQITELEKSRSEAYGGIKSQLESMQLSQQSLAKETQNLVNALRRPEVRGRWGARQVARPLRRRRHRPGSGGRLALRPDGQGSDREGRHRRVLRYHSGCLVTSRQTPM